MIRKLILVVLTLAAVATAIALPLSFPWVFGQHRREGGWQIYHGSIRVLFSTYGYDGAPRWYFESNQLLASGRKLTLIPFYVRGGPVTMLNLPLWTVIVATATYPTIAFIRGPLRRHRRRKLGQCLRCGYSLEGNVTGICSECGRSAKPT